MSLWTDRLDSQGRPQSSLHLEGHRLGLFDDGWWVYHKDYRYTRPGAPRVGPEPAGPFTLLQEAKAFVEAQGFTCKFPLEHV